MTIYEVSERYRIPLNILREYESWKLSGTAQKAVGSHQYNDVDLERLSLIMTLRDVGFATSEIELYMRLLLEQENSEGQRLQILNRKRSLTLEEIHCKEKQLEKLDCLRLHIRKKIQRR
ncbi:MAG: MerR family transcriptional regulator [Ruminococcus sp.]|jgi:DNA-binding transcriptional MerR regulator